MAVVVVGVGVLLGSDVVQLDDVAALVAALDGALTGDLQERERVSFESLCRCWKGYLVHVRSAS